LSPTAFRASGEAVDGATADARGCADVYPRIDWSRDDGGGSVSEQPDQ